MDNDNKKVFVTGVKRNSKILENNLYEIIQKEVVKPILSNVSDDVEEITCNFTPSGGKFYIPKKKSKLKVSTVRDIRVIYEEDILQTLPKELEKQQKLLLRKIKHGFAKDENTRSIAINLLKSNSPICRLSWQMLMNLNPEDKIHSFQYILWDGKCIRVNGCRGGRNKFICNYDVHRAMSKEACKRTVSSRSKLLNKKRSLLRASLDVRFKPGPLSKKKLLDNSYQKHNVGEVKLVNLPKPGLHIQPTYGTALEPTVKTFLQSLRNDDGTISAKWAEFAVSMLGKVTNKAVHIENENFVTFNLSYKFNQNHILMRQDLDSFENTLNDNLISEEHSSLAIYDEATLMLEIRGVIDGIVDAVEISLNQDLMHPPFDEPRDILSTCKRENSTQAKDKAKRRYGELDRLDVTVIRLSESRKKNVSEPCQQTFCRLGCICDSLECNYNLKDYCGRVDCMFKCKCDFSNYKISDSLGGDCSQLYPGLYYLDQKINGKLSKEEQKFHQTVILQDDKSILLKSNRRNWKATKKYADFYNSMRLRSEIKNKKILSVVVTKLNCRNIEPWCMVHSLYKCFCKGKFTESLSYDLSKNEQKQSSNEVETEKVPPLPDVIEKESIDLSATESSSDTVRIIASPSSYLCSRVLPYKGRNHGIKYYKTTNKKILEMEKNDLRLQAKIINILNQSYVPENMEEVNENNTEVIEDMKTGDESNEIESVTMTDELADKSAEVEEKTENDAINDLVDVANVPFKLDELLFNILQEQQKLMDSMTTANKRVDSSNKVETTRTKRLPNKTKLVQWLETSYKKYKEKLNKGFWKTSLSPPRSGKVALYPWNFILSRYRERKNLFLISKQKPFRIFMAVDTRNPFFSKCINVNLIPKSHLDNYPVMIRNLLNDVKDQNETFCILCGLSLCWELVGSVTKVNENKVNECTSNVLENLVVHSENLVDHSETLVRPSEQLFDNSENLDGHSEDSIGHSEDLVGNSENLVEHSENLVEHSENLVENCEDIVDHSEDLVKKSEDMVHHIEQLVQHSEEMPSSSGNENNLGNITTKLAADPKLNNNDNSQVSKWFVMTIENDFIEIQFFKKGFFIKYDSIVRAIVVSRQFGKTVRLSSQKCNEESKDPQFGLYAIPNMYDNCVFIGPYEKDEPLGIEALRKPIIGPIKNKTRGMWITVNKIDNAEVINNPLSFMPSFNKDHGQVITFENDGCSDTNHMTPTTSADKQDLASDKKEKQLAKIPKLVKPVKINKADCFKLPFKMLTKPLSYKCIKGKPSNSSLGNDTTIVQKETEEETLKSSNVTNKSELNEPLAKIPSQIKITNIASLCGTKTSAGKLANSKRNEKGMFVLKPEEINERLAFNYFRVLQPDEINQNSTASSSAVPDIINNSLTSTAICSGDENSRDAPTTCSVVEDTLDCPAAGSSVKDCYSATVTCSVGENSLESPGFYSMGKNTVDASAECSPLTTEVYIISDDEDSNNLPLTISWKDVWISCTNIKNVGWIQGRRNEENKLSFKFPGFANTDFYEEEVAFNKINQVFTRKVYVPKNITIEWRVIENVEDINMEDELTLNYLNTDFVLTKQGLVHKNSLVFRGRKRITEDIDVASSKKIRHDDENDSSDIDNIEVEYIDIPDDKNSDTDDVLGDEKKNDNDKEGCDDGEINEDAFDDEKMQDDDDLFEDKAKMDEYRKVFGCFPTIAAMSKRLKQSPTIKNKKEMFHLDSAD